MNILILTGTCLVFIALLFYTLTLRNERKNRKINKPLLRTLALGLLFDISATICMIAGSNNSPFTLHGVIGYSALFLMCIEGFLIWDTYRKEGLEASISSQIHTYTLVAYCWWIVAFISGGVIAAMHH